MNTFKGEGSVTHIQFRLNMPITTQVNALLTQDLNVNALRQIQTYLPALISAVSVTPINRCVYTQPRHLRAVALYCRNSTWLQSSTLVDLCVSDRFTASGRFAIKYLIFSTKLNTRFAISFSIAETDVVPSLAAPFVGAQRIFAAAGWLEREAWDIFGVYFSGHGDLRRILTDYGFSGHPLRKDFPLTGFREVAYDDTEGRIALVNRELSQHSR